MDTQLSNLGHKMERYARDVLHDLEAIDFHFIDQEVFNEIRRTCFQLLGAAAYLKSPQKGV